MGSPAWQWAAHPAHQDQHGSTRQHQTRQIRQAKLRNLTTNEMGYWHESMGPGMELAGTGPGVSIHMVAAYGHRTAQNGIRLTCSQCPSPASWHPPRTHALAHSRHHGIPAHRRRYPDPDRQVRHPTSGECTAETQNTHGRSWSPWRRRHQDGLHKQGSHGPSTATAMASFWQPAHQPLSACGDELHYC